MKFPPYFCGSVRPSACGSDRSGTGAGAQNLPLGEGGSPVRVVDEGLMRYEFAGDDQFMQLHPAPLSPLTLTALPLGASHGWCELGSLYAVLKPHTSLVREHRCPFFRLFRQFFD